MPQAHFINAELKIPFPITLVTLYTVLERWYVAVTVRRTATSVNCVPRPVEIRLTCTSARTAVVTVSGVNVSDVR